MMTTTNDIADLVDDGDTVKLSDGRVIRLRIEGDDYTSINDFDYYGRIALVEYRRFDDYPHRSRPKGFDGNAEILSVGRSDQVWWQPCADGPKRGTPEFATERQHMLHLLECGFYVITLELLEGSDAYGRPIVVATASLSAVDSVEPQYVAEVVADLVEELAI